MLFTVRSMGKDDLYRIVLAGLHVGLVDWRSHVAAPSSALDGSDDKKRRTTTGDWFFWLKGGSKGNEWARS